MKLAYRINYIPPWVRDGTGCFCCWWSGDGLWGAGLRTIIVTHSEGGGFVRGWVFLLFVCFSLLAVNGSDSHSYSLLVIESIIKRFIMAFQKENLNFSNCIPPTSHIPSDL